jgi:branched-subunit amino acid permease
MIPVSLTTICYIYTAIYIRKSSERVRSIRQKAKDRRDFRVLTRIFILLAAMIVSGMPTLGINLYFQFSGYLPFWSTQFQWLTASFSMCIISMILIFVSPNLQNFYK